MVLQLHKNLVWMLNHVGEYSFLPKIEITSLSSAGILNFLKNFFFGFPILTLNTTNPKNNCRCLGQKLKTR